MKAKLEIIGAMAAFGTIGAFVRHIPLPSGSWPCTGPDCRGSHFPLAALYRSGAGDKGCKGGAAPFDSVRRGHWNQLDTVFEAYRYTRLQWLLSATILPLSS